MQEWLTLSEFSLEDNNLSSNWEWIRLTDACVCLMALWTVWILDIQTKNSKRWFTNAIAVWEKICLSTNVPDKESFTLHFGCKFILYLICWALEEHWIEWRYLSYIEPKVLISKLFELSFLITFTPSTLSILIHLFHFSLSLSLLQFFACRIVAYRNAILVLICTI